MPGRLGVQRGRRSARLGGGYKAQVLADAPLGFWRLDETSGTTIVDASGNGHNGTLTGSNFTLAQPGAIAATDPGAKSIKWTGASTYVAVTGASWMNATAAASWEVWVNPGVNANNSGILSRFNNTGGTTNTFLMWFNTSSQLEMRVQISATAKNAAMNLPQLGIWTHVCATFNGTSLLLYCNGVLVATTAAAGSIDSDTAKGINIGAYQDGGFNLTNHYLDEVAYYGTALPAARVLAHYNAGIGAM